MDTAGQRPRLDRLALDKGRRQRGLFQSLRLDNDRSIKSACPPRFPRSPNGQPSSPHSASLHESLLSPSSAYRSHTDLAQLFPMHFQFDTLNNFYIPDNFKNKFASLDSQYLQKNPLDPNKSLRHYSSSYVNYKFCLSKTILFSIRYTLPNLYKYQLGVNSRVRD